MDNMTVTIKAADLLKLMKLADAAKFDVEWRDDKIKRLEDEIYNLKKQLEDKESEK